MALILVEVVVVSVEHLDWISLSSETNVFFSFSFFLKQSFETTLHRKATEEGAELNLGN
jgi:hypothetical protein